MKGEGMRRALLVVVLAQATLTLADSSPPERALLSAARAGDVAAVRRALRQGATVAARDEHGRTALLVAAHAGSAEAVRALLAAGAEVDAALPSGWTPLMEAAKQGRIAVAEALLAAGANPDARDRAAGTSLDIAQQAGRDEIVALLRRHGARGSGKSVGDRVCVRPWKGAGFCGVVEAVDGNRYLVEVTSVADCEQGCPPDPECSASREVGGSSADAVRAGVSVWTRSWCLTHTGLE
jgi:hypothetical protein